MLWGKVVQYCVNLHDLITTNCSAYRFLTGYRQGTNPSCTFFFHLKKCGFGSTPMGKKCTRIIGTILSSFKAIETKARDIYKKHDCFTALFILIAQFLPNQNSFKKDLLVHTQICQVLGFNTKRFFTANNNIFWKMSSTALINL